MPDYRRMYDDKEHLYAFDLEGKERTLEIAGVSRGELTGENNRKTKKPMVSFVGEPKKLAINKTNGKTISSLYGKDTDEWIGELITLYPTTTQFGSETHDCIRVRPQRPERGDRRAAAAPKNKGRSNGNSTGTYDPDAEHREHVRSVERDMTKQASSSACQYLVSRYEACADEAELATIKSLRGEAWNTMSARDREAVAAAAKAAKERLDAAAAGQPAAGTATADPDADEVAEIARREHEEASRGK